MLPLLLHSLHHTRAVGEVLSIEDEIDAEETGVLVVDVEVFEEMNAVVEGDLLHKARRSIERGGMGAIPLTNSRRRNGQRKGIVMSEADSLQTLSDHGKIQTSTAMAPYM